MANIFRKVINGFHAVAQDRKDRKANPFKLNAEQTPYKLRGGSDNERAFYAAKDGKHAIAEAILLDKALGSIEAKFNESASGYAFNAKQNKNWHGTISEDIRGHERSVFGGYEYHMPYIGRSDLILKHATTQAIVSHANDIGLAVTFDYHNVNSGRGVIYEENWSRRFYPSISFTFSAK